MTGEAHMRLELRVLGGFELRRDGEPIHHWPRAGARQLLKRLVVSERQAMRAEALAESFWPEDSSDRVMQRLHNLLYLVRKTLQPDDAFEPCLRTDGGTVRLITCETLWIDVVEFERQLDAAALSGEQGPLEHALTLYRGRLLGDEADDDWLAPRRAQLEGRFVAVSHRLATLQIQQGRLQAAIQTLNRLLAEVPGHEPAHRELIILYGRLGRAEDVQRQFSECVAILQRELDVEPSAETCTAHRDAQALSSAARPAREADSRRSSPSRTQANAPERWTAPHPVVELLGRDEALRSAVQQLRDGVRLLSLVGTGGIGKTQLAIRVAHEAQEAYPQGACFVPLAEAQPGELYPAIARALGLKLSRQEEPKATVQCALERSRMLLVVDNFEHMLGDAAELALLLQQCVGLALLVTSRIRLNLAMETCMTVLPLPVDSTGLELPDALRLFVKCARRIRPDLALRDDDFEEVTAITRCLGGLPLAIELAAARLPLFSLSELRQAVEASFLVVTGGGADRPRRQRSLLHSFSWSYALLSANEQSLLLLLGLCDASFDRHDARGLVIADAADPELELQTLVELGFVMHARAQVTELDTKVESRFEIAPAIRQFIRQELSRNAERIMLQLRFIDHVVNRVDRLDAAINSADWKQSHAALSEFAVQSPNFFAALNVAQAANQPAEVCRLVTSLAQLWFYSGMWHETNWWIALANTQVQALLPERRARLMLSICAYWREYRCLDQAVSAATRAVEFAKAARQSDEQVRALMLASAFQLERNPDEAADLLCQAETLVPQLNDTQLRRSFAQSWAMRQMDHGDLESARLLLEQCDEEFKQSDDAHTRMIRCAILGLVNFHLGHYVEANARFDQALSSELSAAARPTRRVMFLLQQSWIYCCQTNALEAQQALNLARKEIPRAQAESMLPVLTWVEGQIAFLAGELPKAIEILVPAVLHPSNYQDRLEAHEASLWCFWAAMQNGSADVAAMALSTMLRGPDHGMLVRPRVLEAASAWLLTQSLEEAAALALLQADCIRRQKSIALFPIDRAMSEETRVKLAQRLGADWQTRWQYRTPPIDGRNPVAWLLDVVPNTHAVVKASTQGELVESGVMPATARRR
jgi:predicted ATPase/DNA-binding SARP family transcriptional activator